MWVFDGEEWSNEDESAGAPYEATAAIPMPFSITEITLQEVLAYDQRESDAVIASLFGRN